MRTRALSMDIQRKGVAKNKLIRRAIYLMLAATALAAAGGESIS